MVTFAQGGVGSSRGLPSSAGGVHTIQGRIYFPPGRAVTQLKVRLDGNITGANSTISNIDGSFVFRSLPAGTYNVIIESGTDYEPFRESVTIYGTSAFENRAAPQTISVQVNLRLKGTGTYSGVPKDKVPAKARELYVKGMEAAAKGDSKKAVEHLSEAVSAYSEFADALNELGVQYLKLGQADKGAESLEKAIKLSPQDLHARLNYGFALLSQKKFEEAEAQLRAVLKKNDAMPTAHLYLGITLMNLRRLDDAEAELLLAAGSNSNEVATAHRYLGGIYWGKRDYKRAADELEIYLKLVPKASDAERTRAAIKELRSKQ